MCCSNFRPGVVANVCLVGVIETSTEKEVIHPIGPRGTKDQGFNPVFLLGGLDDDLVAILGPDHVRNESNQDLPGYFF